MPSFDIVSEVNQVELRNALDQANKEISTRFDFKGSDARVEHKEELLTLVAYVKGQGFDGSTPDKTVSAGLAVLGFQQIQDGGFWSSTEYMYYEAKAWIVDMTTGSVSAGEKTLYYSIWPVRSAR